MTDGKLTDDEREKGGNTMRNPFTALRDAYDRRRAGQFFTALGNARRNRIGQDAYDLENAEAMQSIIAEEGKNYDEKMAQSMHERIDDLAPQYRESLHRQLDEARNTR